VEGASGGVTHLPVGLDNSVTRHQVLGQGLVEVTEHLGKEGLVGLAKGQSVTVPGEAVNEVLGKVGPADHSQLTKKCQTATLKPEYHAGPSPISGPALGIGFLGFSVYLLGLLQELRSFRRRKVLQDPHTVDQPLVGRIKEGTVPVVPTLRQRN
jgi:hypothetical protein